MTVLSVKIIELCERWKSECGALVEWY